MDCADHAVFASMPMCGMHARICNTKSNLWRTPHIQQIC